MPPTGHAATPPSAGRTLALLLLALLLAVPVLAQTGPTEGPDVDVLSVSAPLPAKERVTVFFTLLNDGPGNITDVEVVARTTLGSDIVILGQTAVDVGNISENSTDILALRIATGEEEGAAGVLLAISFRDEAGVARTVTREVTLQVGAPRSDPLRIRLMDDTLSAGEESNVTILVNNPSGRMVRDVTVELDLSGASGPSTAGALGGAAGGSGSFSLLRTQTDLAPGIRGDRLARAVPLGPDDTLVLEAPIRTGLRSDELVPLAVVATYTLDGFERTQRFEFGVRVEGPIRFRVLGLREETSGGAREISGTLVNMGPGTAWNPRLTLGDGSGFDAGDGVLLEDLKPNEPASFRLPVARDGEPAPGGAIDLVLEWNDEAGEVDATAVPAEVRLLPDESTEEGGLASFARAWWPLLLVVLAVAILVGFAVHKRRLSAE